MRNYVHSIALTFFSVEIHILHPGCGRVLRPIMHLHVVRHAKQLALSIEAREKVGKTKELLLRSMFNQKSSTMLGPFPQHRIQTDPEDGRHQAG